MVEDEQDMKELLEYRLRREGFEVTAVSRGEQALEHVRDRRPDLILLDLMLPGMDGLEVCRALKSQERTATIPIVMVTAKGEEPDVVVGLEMGADDYVAKPFRPRILIARLRAVLRRRAREDEKADDDSEKPIEFDGLRIELERHEVRVDGEPVELTATEFRLLHLLARRPGRVFTREQILDWLHEGFTAVTDRSVDVQVVSLRRKLGAAADRIQTVRGVGYRFQE